MFVLGGWYPPPRLEQGSGPVIVVVTVEVIARVVVVLTGAFDDSGSVVVVVTVEVIARVVVVLTGAFDDSELVSFVGFLEH